MFFQLTLIIDKESGCLVPERDVEALTEKLELLVTNPQKWQKMGICGRKHIEENYDIIKQVQKLEEIYDTLSKN